MKSFTIDFLGETQFGSAFLRLALSVALCFAILFETRADAPAPGTNRFLLIVDTSVGMKKLAEPLREAVFDLVYSGARGAMTNGDSYGVWFAGGQNDTSMGVDTWKQKFAVEIAARIALRVKEQGFKGKSVLDAAIADAAHVAELVGDVTVIIASNGDAPIRGTPFDDAINARIKQLAPEMQRVNAILNTAIVAQDGKFVAWAVNSPDFLITLPDVPPRPIKKEPVVAKADPNPVAKTNAAPAVVAKPKPTVNPIIITRETVDREKQIYRAMATTDSANAPVAAAAESPKVITNTLSVAAATNASVHTTNVTPVPTLAPSTPVTSALVATKTNASETPTPLVRAHAKTIATAHHETPSPTNAAVLALTQTPPATSAPSLFSRKLLWAFAGGGIVLVVLVGVALVRRARELEPSLISQAAAMERMRQ